MENWLLLIKKITLFIPSALLNVKNVYLMKIIVLFVKMGYLDSLLCLPVLVWMDIMMMREGNWIVKDVLYFAENGKIFVGFYEKLTCFF